MSLNNNLNLRDLKIDFNEKELDFIKEILNFYDEYLDNSHNSKHILQTINNVEKFYNQMCEVSDWFKNNTTSKMCKVIMLCHDLGNIEPIFDYISSKFINEIFKNPDWDKQKIIRKNHHFTGYKFIYLINNNIDEINNLDLPFNAENLKNLCSNFNIELIYNAIYHHRASVSNDFELNDLDMFVRSCDGFSSAESVLTRAKDYAVNNIAINKNDKNELGKIVRLHMIDKYVGERAYAETLPINFIDNKYKEELKKITSILNSYNNDYNLCKYIETLEV